MSSSHILIVSVVLAVALSIPCVLGQTIDCQRPPRLVDPSLCCRDGGRDQIADKCVQRIIGEGVKTGMPSLETSTCLAECILTTSQYIQDPQKLHLDNIRSNLSAKFSNDTAYVEAMTAAFTKCEPQSQRRLAAIQQSQPQHKCSPFSAIVLGCTYMEYFKNCPEHRWTQNADCDLAKTYVTQCGLGA
ncbi:uncharacterized protein LOC117890182 [Drosophila subobscura]|uniref:uncharacterized protein LOC117890182 n=1 Tax=Drosophila subobscura TaxID=7241 RepID=UPI00155B2C2D|nr:uncharacterized protein LOC117890182 [Drosophila subobscura]